MKFLPDDDPKDWPVKTDDDLKREKRMGRIGALIAIGLGVAVFLAMRMLADAPQGMAPPPGG